MLYTLSKAQYELNELTDILAQIKDNDALVLWQDGVLLAVKYPNLFTAISHFFVLNTDLQARGLSTTFPTLSLKKFISLTEQHSSQIAL